jgi:hypothetical protein
MEKIFCEYDKDTDNKHRWKAMVGNAPLEIYIPKWRAPDPRPLGISVEIFEPADDRCPIVVPHGKKEVEANQRLRLVPITAEVTYKEDKTLTARYDPVLEGNNAREIGSPYIPFALCYSRPKRLVIVIKWENKNGNYHNSTY